ncbi:arylsulfotransferase family protein [Symbioplanes lichenis]|uniref:arylsulfotransferase family protein n=1 Tax=Symbioplanes lichenis TaxID=1629072 RepID=UPI0027396A7D|nr:arylsulfotransferase family protein [Actinoplanes lichenis]
MTSRRTVLLGIGGAVVVAAAGGGVGYALAPSDDPEPAQPAATPAAFKSRPDLNPVPVTITTPATGTTPGVIMLTPFATATGPLIVNQAGQPVWYRSVPPPATVAIDFKGQTYRGEPVLTWWEGTIGGTGGQGVGQGEFVVADSAYREITRVRAVGSEQADQHDFVITPQNTALFWVYDPIPYDLTPLGGPADGVLHEGVIQEVDIETGERLWQWRSSEHVPIDESYAPVPTGDSAHLPYDYFHANSVGLDADGNVLVSARHTWTTYKINKQTGDIMWRVGGKKSSFTVAPDAAFSWQHDFRRRSDGTYSVFDNGAGLTQEKDHSRGLIFSIDEKAKTVAMVREFTHPAKLLAPTQGNFRELPDGGSFVGWGQSPWFTEYAPDGTVRLDGHLPLDNQSYRAYKIDWAGAPADQPALGLRVENNTVIVNASWNGATAVARWRARSGSQPGQLAQPVEAASAGFETELTIPGMVEYVAVDALDAAGQVLGTSSAIPVRV